MRWKAKKQVKGYTNANRRRCTQCGEEQLKNKVFHWMEQRKDFAQFPSEQVAVAIQMLYLPNQLHPHILRYVVEWRDAQTNSGTQ